MPCLGFVALFALPCLCASPCLAFFCLGALPGLAWCRALPFGVFGFPVRVTDTVTVGEHLFFLFGWILLITAKWDLFFTEAKWLSSADEIEEVVEDVAEVIF